MVYSVLLVLNSAGFHGVGANLSLQVNIYGSGYMIRIPFDGWKTNTDPFDPWMQRMNPDRFVLKIGISNFKRFVYSGTEFYC